MKSRHGFTVLEMIVVATLLALLTLLLGKMWQGVVRPTSHLIARTRVLQEATLALAALQRDFCGALAEDDGRLGQKSMAKLVGRLQPDNSELWLCFDGGTSPNGLADWANPDTVIVYSLIESRLVRTNQSTGSSYTVATSVQQFEVTNLGSRVQIRLTFSFRDMTSTYTFIGCDPL